MVDLTLALAQTLQSAKGSLGTLQIVSACKPHLKKDVNSMLYKWLRSKFVTRTCGDGGAKPQWQLTDEGRSMTDKLTLTVHIRRVLSNASDEEKSTITAKLLRRKLAETLCPDFVESNKELVKTIACEELSQTLLENSGNNPQ